MRSWDLTRASRREMRSESALALLMPVLSSYDG